VDRATVRRARNLLESLMLRRVKADVEASLPPKLEFTLKVPAWRGTHCYHNFFSFLPTLDPFGFIGDSLAPCYITYTQCLPMFILDFAHFGERIGSYRK
jgi:hypothetical protein